MLTEKEKEWLERRIKYKYFSCQYCNGRNYPSYQYGKCVHAMFTKRNSPECYKLSIISNAVDVAKFEARVAARLATNQFRQPCMSKEGCFDARWGCYACHLKYARLQVEEEMENE